MSDAHHTDGSSEHRPPFDRHAVDDEALTAAKSAYEPSMTCLADICRRPFANPFATLALAAILAVFGWQAYEAAIQYHPVVGGVVLLFAYLSYRIAKIGWRVENDHIATELALRDLRRDDPQE